MIQKSLINQNYKITEKIFLIVLVLVASCFFFTATTSAAVGDEWKQKCATYHNAINRASDINTGAAHGSGKPVDVKISEHQKIYNDLCKPKNKPKNAKKEGEVTKEIQKRITAINDKLEDAGYSRTKPAKTEDDSAPSTDGHADPALSCDPNNQCDLFAKYINPIINVLAALVAIAVTIGIISGGIRYASASDDPQKMNAAKSQIQNAIIALIAFFFLYAGIKWLMPAA